MSDHLRLFRRATDGFASNVHLVGVRQWHDATPCDEWDVRMLVNHVAVEQLWVPLLVAGSSVGEIGDRLDGDHLDDDPVAAWDAALNAARSAFGAPGALETTVVLSSGEKSTAEYCWEMTTDALIHSWDLARGIGADETLDAELVGLVYEQVLPIADHLQETGLFAPPVPVPDDAPLQTKLLALFGRRA
jgi:uncharacterized protein (TIGR03086 family)